MLTTTELLIINYARKHKIKKTDVYSKLGVTNETCRNWIKSNSIPIEKVKLLGYKVILEGHGLEVEF